MLEFIVLGQIPGTRMYINFYTLVAISLAGLLVIWTAHYLARRIKQLPARITHLLVLSGKNALSIKL